MSRLSTPNTSCECVCTIEQRALTVIVFAVPRRVGVGRRERLKPSLPRFHLGDSGPVIVRLRRRRRRVAGVVGRGGRMRRHRSEQRALGIRRISRCKKTSGASFQVLELFTIFSDRLCISTQTNRL